MITAPILFGRLYVLPVVADFLAQFAEINVRLLLSDRYVHLVDDHVDMAVRIGSLPDSALVATRIGSMRSVICASPALLAEHGVPRTPEDLQRLPCVAIDSSMSTTVAGSTPEVGRARRRPGGSASYGDDDGGGGRRGARGVGVTRLLHYQVAEAVERRSCNSCSRTSSRSRPRCISCMRRAGRCRSRCAASSTLPRRG